MFRITSPVSPADADSPSSIEIDVPLIDKLVRGFYARVREDALLGPIFEERVADWEGHLLNLIAFWSSVMLSTGTYSGRPMPKHAVLPIDGTHFARWLELFESSARDLCPGIAAERFIDRAHRMAESLQLGLRSMRSS